MNINGKNTQVTSKQRVSDHGEVFTSEREVNAMLDMVRHETERIESRFLEPACGSGNFLAPVYEKKLAVIKKRYGRSQLEFERYVVIGTGSIYGVEILEDNVNLCRERLFTIFDELYTKLYKEKSKDAMRNVIRFILERNILWGDALSLKQVDDKKEPIVFSEWSLVNGSKIKRRDFQFVDLAEFEKKGMTSMFRVEEVSDTGELVFSPKPVKEYPVTHFLEIHL